MGGGLIFGNIVDETRPPEEGQIYYYFSGGLYLIVAVGRHTETGQILVCYRSILGEERPTLITPIKVWNEVMEDDGRLVLKFTLMHPIRDDE